MPDAVRISDHHSCPKVEPGPVPHVGGPIATGSANVIIGFLPAARVDDSVLCYAIQPPDRIKTGSSTVIINHRAAARRSDPCRHIAGALLGGGCPSVVIGDSPQSSTFRLAARLGAPLCEDCERKRLASVGPEEATTADEAAPADPNTASIDDDKPPPGAVAPRDRLSTHYESFADLAGQTDQNDGRDSDRQAARVALAFTFYLAHGGPRVKPSKICSHVAGIDVTKPVEVTAVAAIAAAAEAIYQHCIPHAKKNGEHIVPDPNIEPKKGEYFVLDPSIRPEQVGASSKVYAIVNGKPTPPPVDRELHAFKVDRAPPVLGLRSIAAPVTDKWSMPAIAGVSPGKGVECEGGSMQIMIPRKFHSSIKYVSRAPCQTS